MFEFDFEPKSALFLLQKKGQTAMSVALGGEQNSTSESESVREDTADTEELSEAETAASERGEVKAASDKGEAPRTAPKEIWGWLIYDAANSVYYNSVLAAFLPTFLFVIASNNEGSDHLFEIFWSVSGRFLGFSCFFF